MDAGEGSEPTVWSRAFGHWWRAFLTKEDKARIVAAIAEAESHTTGEICVHVTAHAGRGDILALAQRRFSLLRLDRTDARNGVLILVSHLDRRFAIWGDAALHTRGGKVLWERASEALAARFAEGRYAAGIEACVRELGEELARHFPKVESQGRNQLSNEISED